MMTSTNIRVTSDELFSARAAHLDAAQVARVAGRVAEAAIHEMTAHQLCAAGNAAWRAEGNDDDDD